MGESFGERSAAYSSELQKIEASIRNCEECGGTGIQKYTITNKLFTFSQKARQDLDAFEDKRLRIQRRKASDFSEKKNENPQNSSYGLCECRIRADQKRTLVIGNLPHSFSDIRYPDIISRDITIVGDRKIDIKSFIRFYTKRFSKAKRSSLGCNFFGGNGRGKTFIASFIAAQLALRRYSIHYIPFFLLIDTMASGNFQTNLLFREIMGVDFLVIDDIGNEQQYRRKACNEIAFFLKQRNSKRLVNLFIFNIANKREDLLEFYDSTFVSTCTDTNMDIVLRTKIMNERINRANMQKFLKRLM